jgi:hypothetical protein
MQLLSHLFLGGAGEAVPSLEFPCTYLGLIWL